MTERNVNRPTHGRHGSRAQRPDASTRYDGNARTPERANRASHAATPQGAINSRRAKRTILQWRTYGIAAFAGILVLGCLIGLIWFARPTQGLENEKRNLTPFPTDLTLETFLDGSYFTELSLWYADTYPLRNPMVAANNSLKHLYGFAVDEGILNQGKGDEIPVEGDPSAVEVKPLADPPTEQAISEDIQANIMSGVFVNNGAGYSIYYFDQSSADTYIQAMNTAAERLDSKATVYSMFAPASSIMLDPETAKAVGGSDQQQTLDYLSTRFDSRVKAVNVLEGMEQHTDEYLYFYTDHHWTQLGAYRAYEQFCKAKGITPVSLDKREHQNLGELVGTYTDTIESMGSIRHDTMDVYLPIGTNEMEITYEDGHTDNVPVINTDAVNWDASARYNAFIAGDQPLDVIHNPNITDGSSCLIVKDSYGCAFAPLMVDSYETVHVIDFRYTDKNICDYALENNIQDVIFLTGMKIGLVQTVADTLLVEVS